MIREFEKLLTSNFIVRLIILVVLYDLIIKHNTKYDDFWHYLVYAEVKYYKVSKIYE